MSSQAHTLADPVFGHLEREDPWWRGRMRFPALAACQIRWQLTRDERMVRSTSVSQEGDGHVAVVVHDEAGDGPDEPQRAAYRSLMKNQDQIAANILSGLVFGMKHLVALLDDATYQKGTVLYQMKRWAEAEEVLSKIMNLPLSVSHNQSDAASMLEMVREKRRASSSEPSASAAPASAPSAQTASGGKELWQILDGAEVKHGIKVKDISGRDTTLSDESFAGPNVASVILIPRTNTIPSLIRIAGTVQCHGCRARFPFEFLHAGSPFDDKYLKGRACPCGNELQYLLRRCKLHDNEGILLAAKPSTSVWGQRSSPLKLFVEGIAETTASEGKARELQTPEGIEADFVENELPKEKPDFRGLAQRLERFSPEQRRGVWIGLAQQLQRSGNKKRSMKCYMEAMYNAPSDMSVAWGWLSGNYDKDMAMLPPNSPKTRETVEKLRRDFGSILDE